MRQKEGLKALLLRVFEVFKKVDLHHSCLLSRPPDFLPQRAARRWDLDAVKALVDQRVNVIRQLEGLLGPSVLQRKVWVIKDRC
jgi:hypothetical protein